MELVDSARCLVIDANNLTPIIANTKWITRALAQDWQRNFAKLFIIGVGFRDNELKRGF